MADDTDLRLTIMEEWYRNRYNEALSQARFYYGNCPTEPEKKKLETIFPELRESEDEMMINELQGFLDSFGADYFGTGEWQKFHDWLEKQKEPVVDKEGMYYYLGGKFIYCGYPATEKNPYDFAMSQQEKQKEQKPSIFPPGFGEVHWNPILSGKDVHEWNLPEDFEEAVYKVANFISPFDSQDELRRVSHRFAEQLMSLAKKELVENCAPEIMQRVSDEVDEMLQKEQIQGWSEEDEMMLNSIIATCELAEQDRHSGPAEHLLETQRIWLKSRRPSWKPSEEQMTNLLRAEGRLRIEGESVLASKLAELYEQLKKLCNQ